MFGRRFDGKVNNKIDPIVRMTSLIMPRRSDAQVILKKEINYDILSDYVKKKRAEGYNISHMNVLIAAFAKTVCQRPEFNRFIMNRKIYDRNELCVSYTILKEKVDDNYVETTIKLKFDNNDNIYTVSKKMQDAVNENKDLKKSNVTDKLAKIFLSIPFLPPTIINFIRLIDRYGMLPKKFIDASPFHTSMFVTNMASIRMSYVYHHIYDFGTTSIFFAMGKKEQKLTLEKTGEVTSKNIMPLGIVIDERICSGAEYARGLSIMERYLAHPETLEE